MKRLGSSTFYLRRRHKKKKKKTNNKHKSSDVVLGLGLWSLVVLKDQISVLGPVLGLEGAVLANDSTKDQGQRQHH